jgi:hypothetical protein
MPAIEKIKGVTEYDFQQSKYYPECMRAPFRACLCAGSASGKTTTILAMCLQIYGFEVFQRYIVVSPSIGIDDAWNPLFAEMRKRGMDPDEYTLDHYDDAWIMKHLDTARSVCEYQKKHKQKKLFQVCFILDDISDSGPAVKASGSGQGALSTMLCRSRHFGCSVVLSLQKLYTAPTLLRCSFSDILLWKLKSARERDSALQEVTALVKDRATLETIYNRITEKPYAFMWIALNRSDPNDILHDGFGPGIQLVQKPESPPK